VLQRVAVCCSVLQCVAVCCITPDHRDGGAVTCRLCRRTREYSAPTAWVMSHKKTRHVTYKNESCHAHGCVTTAYVCVCVYVCVCHRRKSCQPCRRTRHYSPNSLSHVTCKKRVMSHVEKWLVFYVWHNWGCWGTIVSCPPASLPTCLPVCLSICLSVCLSACLSVCLFVCQSVYLFVCLSRLTWLRPQQPESCTISWCAS